MRAYDTAIFDLDGTILDTLTDLRSSLNYALAGCGYPQRSPEEVRRFVGNGVRKLIERGAPAGTDPAQLDRLYTLFNEHYSVHSLDATRPYPGIPELLQNLRSAGVQLAVVSNKVDYAVKTLCSRFYADLFDVTVGELPGIAKKPAPDLVNLVLEKLHADRAHSVYIGDTEVDIQTARNAGLAEILVPWGFRDRQELVDRGARRLAESPEDVYRMIAGPAES